MRTMGLALWAGGLQEHSGRSRLRDSGAGPPGRDDPSTDLFHWKVTKPCKHAKHSSKPWWRARHEGSQHECPHRRVCN